ncbi:MAG: macro domain-containing protein [Roseiflexaceae bacterium]
MQYQINQATLAFVRGDIVVQDVDAIVNATNETLRPAGGVSGAIHRAAGPDLEVACVALGGCEPGHAQLTPGFRLKARYVIHAVGPRYAARPNDAAVLEQAYRSALQLAAEQQVATLACPAISTGIFGYPVDLAAPVAVRTVARFLEQPSSLRLVRFVLWDDAAYRAFTYAARKLGPGTTQMEALAS